MRILLTNDDGIQAEGMLKLREKLMDMGHYVITAVPLHDASGASFTLHIDDKPFEVIEAEPYTYVVDSTPISCIIFAMTVFGEKEKFDLIISGINDGENKDLMVLSSGTCSAALFASLQYQIPSVALSVENKMKEKVNWDMVVSVAKDVVDFIEQKSISRGFINVNIPNTLTRPKGIILVPFIPKMKVEPVVKEEGRTFKFNYYFDYISDDLYNYYDVVKMSFVSVDTDYDLYDLFRSFKE